MIKEKIYKLVKNEKFPYICLVVGLIAILSMIVYGFILSITRGEAWEKVEGCIENSFLAICLFVIVINFRKDKHHIVEALMGELLAIYLVTNTTYFVETLIEEIENPSTIFEYIYLVLEFMIMLSSIILFFDHLNKSHDKKVEESNRIIQYVMIGIIFLVLIFDIMIILINHSSFDVLVIIDEIIYIIFGISLTLSVLSQELIRVDKEA